MSDVEQIERKWVEAVGAASSLEALESIRVEALGKKGEFRRLWIQRINAACRLNDISYSRFIAGLNAAGIEVDRKVLSDLAITEPGSFKALVEKAQAALGNAN